MAKEQPFIFIDVCLVESTGLEYWGVQVCLFFLGHTWGLASN